MYLKNGVEMVKLSKEDEYRYGLLKSNIESSVKSMGSNELAMNELRRDGLNLQLSAIEQTNKVQDVYIDISKAMIIVLIPAIIAIIKIEPFNTHSAVAIIVCVGFIIVSIAAIIISLKHKNKNLKRHTQAIQSFIDSSTAEIKSCHENNRMQVKHLSRELNYFKSILGLDRADAHKDAE